MLKPKLYAVEAEEEKKPPRQLAREAIHEHAATLLLANQQTEVKGLQLNGDESQRLAQVAHIGKQ